jgi:hypothetical protein
LEEKLIYVNGVERKKKILAMQNRVEDLIQIAKTSKEGMYFLVSSVFNIETSFDHIVPSTMQDRI